MVHGMFAPRSWKIISLCSYSAPKASYKRAHRMVREPLANSLQIKCAYVCTRLRTYAALSANGSHPVRCEPKFVSFQTQRELDAPCVLPIVPGVLCSPQVYRKLINRAPNMRSTRTVCSCVQGFVRVAREWRST